MTKSVDNSSAQYVQIERAFEVLKYLKENTCKGKSLTQAEIMEHIHMTTNERTLSTTIQKLIKAVNPDDYDGNNLGEFRIRHKALDEIIQSRSLNGDEYDDEYDDENDLDDAKCDADDSGKEKDQHPPKTKATPITDLWYVHDFSENELDSLIESLYFSKTITDVQREILIQKVAKLSTLEYQSEHIDCTGNSKIRMDGIYENSYGSMEQLQNNLAEIQKAIKCDAKISFFFNGYTQDKLLDPTMLNGKEKRYEASPYHIVAYNGKYYLVANTQPHKNVSFYRIDLMSSVEIIAENTGNMEEFIKRFPENKVKGLEGKWDAVAFISQHLYMFYDNPMPISMKIRNDRYTVLHDWFGDHFRFRGKIDNEYDDVTVTCSPNAMIHWALQYGDYVEILNKDLRKTMKEHCREILSKYEND